MTKKSSLKLYDARLKNGQHKIKKRWLVLFFVTVHSKKKKGTFYNKTTYQKYFNNNFLYKYFLVKFYTLSYDGELQSQCKH